MAGMDQEVDDLFGEWQDAIVERRRHLRRLAAAIAKMPWWAQPGPDSINSNGTSCGTITWVPAIQEFTLPRGMIRRVIRPSESEFQRRHELRWGSPRDAVLEGQLADLKKRKAAQQHEIVTAGVDVLQRQKTNLDQREWKAANAIEKLGPSPAVLAFDIIDRLSWNTVGSACWSRQWEATKSSRYYHAGRALKNLIPALPPRLRASAERIIKPGAGPMSKWAHWCPSLVRFAPDGGEPPDSMIRRLLAVATEEDRNSGRNVRDAAPQVAA